MTLLLLKDNFTEERERESAMCVQFGVSGEHINIKDSTGANLRKYFNNGVISMQSSESLLGKNVIGFINKKM